VYPFILGSCSRVEHTPDLPSAYETTLGWIILGQDLKGISSPSVSLLLTTEPSISQLIRTFWEIEEPSPPVNGFTDDQKCEEHFQRTTSRDSSGRFSVSLPFRDDPSLLGESRSVAISRFYNLERKLQRDSKLFDEYRKFMTEYEQLGHMQVSSSEGKYYIPHHAVVKYTGTQMKLRVVFDASATTTFGKSLNDLLYVGPKLQSDISQLLHRCRFVKYMMTADICKMYRQIRVHKEDRLFQHIVWRNNPSEELKDFELNTVTYGVSSSPFQAIRVLHQLEKDDGHRYPFANKILSTQTYVDDIITGHDDISGVLRRRIELIQLLNRAGLTLRKWSSNCKEVLNQIPKEDQASTVSFESKEDTSLKILGMHWDPIKDSFTYYTSSINNVWTKRSILSVIAKLYDPLGILAPVTFWAKCFMQTLWKSGLHWDEVLPVSLSNTWQQFASELPILSKIKLHRYISTSGVTAVQLLAFSDASEKGYAAIIYIRCIYEDDRISVHLLTAKSKVAPLKMGKTESSLTIPRLELCGALLLARTLNYLMSTLQDVISITSVHAWTDSRVVLSWLTTPQSHFKIFVTNRLAKIRELIPSCQWHYVPSVLNPADCVSRGILPSQLIKNTLYWEGPQFIQQPMNEWPNIRFEAFPVTELPDVKQKIILPVCSVATIDEDSEWFNRFSTLNRMQRVTAYMIRFGRYTRRLSVQVGPLSREELDEALEIIIRSTQIRYLSNLFHSLQIKDSKITPRSIAQLAPFLDEKGIIRVGGRLQKSKAMFDTQFPILLPKVSTFTTLLIRHYHLVYLHSGMRQISALLSRKFWVICGRSAIRRVIFQCVVCARHRAVTPQPSMGNLPSCRVNSSRPFSQLGIDFAGPFAIKESRRKNAKSTKCYLAVYVCMATKAVHLEIVSDLTTDAFLASLNRVISRRGIPSDIYTDCGTNFKGADRRLQQIFIEQHSQNMYINTVPCRWHFNPPAAPHFGGLWEAAVKSTKFHLRRVIGNQLLTFEELTTLSTRIEAILNSRPLTALSTDPNDLQPLTPGHFLIGQPLVALPERDTINIPQNRLHRWELLQQLHQTFWKRWSNEYLTSLQARTKWTRQQPNIEVGNLVLINTPNLPPTQWKLGRIEKTYPGDDGTVRVVTIRTIDGSITRPVVKIIVLPVDI